jgi:hypothetical protein
MTTPEGFADSDHDDEGGNPGDPEEPDDEEKCPPVADIWRARVEDLGGNINVRQ